MLAVQDITVQFGGESLFEGISFLVNRGDRVGLVGKNGAGKSTLLKILYSGKGFDAGSINAQKNVSVGYLSQDLDFEKGCTVMEEAEKAFVRIKQIQSTLDRLQNEMINREDYESESYLELINQVSEVEHELQVLGGYSYHAQIEKILFGLGFVADDFQMLTDTFSGGWRMRIELAKILLVNPDILLLDEPTNHLDIESILWLEGFLKTFSGALILVSHDKTFLDQVCNRTIEIANHKIYDYKAPYSKYLHLRVERIEQQAAMKKNQDKEIKQTQELIDKFRYKASKAAFAQNLIKKLEQMERVEVDTNTSNKINFAFSEASHSGKVVLEIEGLHKAYDDKVVIDSLDLQIDRGDRIAFVGQNGQGKTTLVKCITKNQDYQGLLKLGHNVQLSYFAQNQAELLEPNATVLQIIEDAADDTQRPKSRDLLGSFLFSGEDVDKNVKVLSGGERSRLALCKMLLKPSNVLILDEPTNHLDIASKEVLKQAMMKYSGTLILVSHDRDFLDGLCTKVLEFRDGHIKTFLGEIKDYLASRQLESMRELEKKTEESKMPAHKQLDKEDRKDLEKQIKKLRNQLSKIEKSVEDLESEIEACDAKLADPETSAALLSDADFFTKYEALKKEMDIQMEDWEDIQLQYDDLIEKRTK